MKQLFTIIIFLWLGCLAVWAQDAKLIKAHHDYVETFMSIPIKIDLLENDKVLTEESELFLLGFFPVEPAHGTYLINLDGSVVYTPESAFSGIDFFSYVIMDSKGHMDTANVYVCVMEVDAVTSCYPTTTATSITSVDACDDPCSGSLSFMIEGSAPPYYVAWNGDPSFIVLEEAFELKKIDLCAGSYSLIVFTEFGLSDTTTFVIENTALAVDAGFSQETYVDDPVFLEAAILTEASVAEMAWGPPHLLDNPYILNPKAVVDETTTFYFTAVDTSGCIKTDSVVVEVKACPGDCVYPGDANKDGVTNHYDVLPLGLSFGTEDVERVDQSILWHAHDCDPWEDLFASGVNFKHADTNGDGVVNHADTSAIRLNYGRTYAISGKTVGEGIPFYVDEVPDGFSEGETVQFDLHLGNPEMLVSDFYGIAFSLDLSGFPAYTNSIEFVPTGSMLGSATELLVFQYTDISKARLDIAITRTDGAGVSGWGKIGTVRFIASLESSLLAGDIRVQSNIMGIEADEEEVAIRWVDLASGITSVDALSGPIFEVQLFPNPAHDALTIAWDQGLSNEATDIKIFNTAGVCIYKQPLLVEPLNISVAAWPEGVYQVVWQQGQQLQTKKLVIFH